jgi:hypothetical protein
MCIGETNSITINGAGTSYSVNSNPSAANFTIAPSGPTNYSITSLGTNGCLGSTVYSQIVSPCLGIGTKSLNEDIGVYPNPNNGTFVLSGNTTSTFFIFNEVGQLIKTGSVLAGSDTVISGLSSGIYFLISDSMKKKIVVFAN